MIEYIRLLQNKRKKPEVNHFMVSRTDELLRIFKNNVADIYLAKNIGDGITMQSLADSYGKSISTVQRWINTRKEELRCKV
jgi:hypothetical protein